MHEQNNIEDDESDLMYFEINPLIAELFFNTVALNGTKKKKKKKKMGKMRNGALQRNILIFGIKIMYATKCV